MKVSGKTLAHLAKAHAALGVADMMFEAKGGKISMNLYQSGGHSLCLLDYAIDGAEEMAVVGDGKRIRDALLLFAKDEEVEMRKVGSWLHLQAGGRKKKLATDPVASDMPNPKMPSNVQWAASATVPVDFMRRCCEQSTDGSISQLSIGDGRLKWFCEGDLGSFEDTIECAIEGEATSTFSADSLATMLSIIQGDCLLRICDGGPLMMEAEVPSGKAAMALAPFLRGDL
jgi:hypothetical protein